ncbi:MAG: CapA family protein, partial [Lachnospiraceae bacterium]|nr:CapA family protein [Lachnospiraceae bacterium]
MDEKKSNNNVENNDSGHSESDTNGNTEDSGTVTDDAGVDDSSGTDAGENLEADSPVDGKEGTSTEESEGESEDDTSDDASTETGEKRFTFTATGDNLVHSYIYQQAAARGRNGHYAFYYGFKDVADFFKNNDLNWINQETLCTDTLTPSSYPCFSTPGDSARALYKMNMRIFNVSTNHTYD